MANYEAQNYIVTNGLVLNLDAGDPDSYTRSQPPYVEVLVVAGGGGGGSHVGGGGGAGGLIYNTAYQLSSAAAVTVTVGGGGTGGSPDQRGGNGSNSVFGSITAIGGGGGGTWGGAGNPDGLNGGSGGGAAGTEGVQFATGGTGTAGQGFNGGNVGPRSGGNSSGVGGGGAGGGSLSRADASDPTQINGGPGLPFSILGTSYYFSGGGGGGAYFAVNGGNGGIGGGGGGASTGGSGGTGDTNSINAASNGSVGSGAAGGAAATNSGGGGGAGAGGASGIGAAGGSGIVIVRYPGLPAATGGTITYLNGYTIHTFTSSGTFTPYLWNDVSGNGNNGTLVNGVTFNSYQSGRYFDFDGTDDHVLYPSLLNVGNTFTVNFWIKPTSKTRQTIFSNGYPYQPNKGFFITCPGNVATEFFISLGNDQKYTTSNIGALTTGTWQMVTVRVNGASELMKLYVNSIETSYQAQMDANITVQYNTGVFVTGINNSFSGDVLESDIGVLQIYNRALSQTEITQNFNAQKDRFGLGWPSAQAILAAYPNATSGYYPIQPLGSSTSVMVYCDMETDGGGWMHVGTVNDSGGNSNDPVTMPWGAPLNPAQNTGIWQDTNTLNESSPSFTTNYKNRVWYLSSFTQMLIKDQGDTQRNLLYTNSGQISSNNSSLSTWFGSLSWAANGSEDSNSAYNNGRVKGVSITNFGVADPLLDSGNKTILLFKFGEYDGAQDGNKDRSMIAWARYNAADNVDTPAGIGTFTNRGGTIDYRDVVPYAQRQDYPYPTITGGPYNYSIWVR